MAKKTEAIKLGENYRDSITGFEGIAIARHEYLYGSLRVTLQALYDGDIKEFEFDAPSLAVVPPPTDESHDEFGPKKRNVRTRPAVCSW